MHPGSNLPTLGILGGGQLGRMTALAAIRMGLRVRFLVDEASGPTDGLGDTVIGNWQDPEVLRTFAASCDAVTCESEWAPLDVLARVLPEGVSLQPGAETIRIIRDKGLQKKVLQDAGLPVPPFEICGTIEEAERAAERFGFPVLLKRIRGSYDGYGNATVRLSAEIAALWASLSSQEGLIVEAWVPFVRELAVIVARSEDGHHVVYPVAQTEQVDHRCHAVTVPAPVTAEVAARAREVGLAAVEAVNGVGITAVELFEMADGSILINELAPRPHNTGHYSIEACYTSQFENHVRAVLGWPLGSPEMRMPAAVMINVLGKRSGTPSTEGLQEALATPGTSVHLYGKRSVRPRRKMGHVTCTGDDAADVRTRAERAASLIHL